MMSSHGVFANPVLCHSRAGGNPYALTVVIGPRLRGDDKKPTEMSAWTR